MAKAFQRRGHGGNSGRRVELFFEIVRLVGMIVRRVGCFGRSDLFARISDCDSHLMLRQYQVAVIASEKNTAEASLRKRFGCSFSSVTPTRYKLGPAAGLSSSAATFNRLCAA